MLYGNKRESYRQVFVDSWEAYRQGRPLAGVMALIVPVILRHPEYQALLANPDAVLDRDFPPEAGQSNPFMHMALHVSLAEFLALDQPTGIAALYAKALEKTEAHALQHFFVECLGEAVWQAQRYGAAPDFAAMLDCVRRRLALATPDVDAAKHW